MVTEEEAGAVQEIVLEAASSIDITKADDHIKTTS
jgi:hypothetical protein